MKKTKAPKITLGLMSGTSVDAIDASLLFTDGKKDHVLLHVQHEYPKSLRNEILSLIRSQSIDLANLTKIHYQIGESFAKTAELAIKVATRKKIISKNAPIFSVGSHGQTVFHDPEAKRTLQIGEGSIIAAKTGITTVSDFRMADTALGGEGAPLLPFYHRRLFENELKKGVVVHNLGGISNYTYMNSKEIFALDTGPANCLLDGAIQMNSNGKISFDKNGDIARKGKLSKELLAFLKKQPGIATFCKKRAPKSTGRELFSPKLLEQAIKTFPQIPFEDLMHSLAHFTADLIVDSYRKDIGNKPLEKIIFAGGGSQNGFILDLLENKFGKKVDFYTMEDFGWSAQALESQAFAYFSMMAIIGKPITFAGTTGVRGDVICGKISPGKNWISPLI